ncbi:MAG: hypothetical protein KBT27_01585 [Prevotellaceae bacterium]|nr:hypothetical protein [Candidatus Faecinaster equi]
MSVYIFVYSNSIGDRDTVKAALEAMPEVLRWRYDIPNCFYLISDFTAEDLTESLLKQLSSESKRFLIMEVSKNRQGYLSKDTWDFLRGE